MNIRTAALIAAVALGTAVGFAAACSDATEPPASTAPHSQATTSTAPPAPVSEGGTRNGVAPTRASAAAAFHRKNRMDWVGVAHNRGLDVFRAELRAHEYPSLRRLCEGVLELALRDSLQAPGHAQMSTQQRRRILEGVLSGTPGCSGLHTSMVPAPSMSGAPLVHVASYVPAGSHAAFVQSVSVESLLNQITYAVASASDLTSLAIQLDQISGAAAVLEPTAQDAVLGAASLALSSVEYWQANYPSFEAEVLAEYGCGSLNCEEPYSVIGSTARRQFAQGAWRAAKTIGGYDISAGFATILKTWLAGPIGWEAAGDAALVGSAVGAVHYILELISPT